MLFRSLLRGEIGVRLREDPQGPTRAKKKTKGTTALDEMTAGDRDLFERLRELRKQIAQEQGVPPYVIFHDATLMQMVNARPTRLDQLLELNGMGKTKLEKYGQAFLACLTRD